ncbi:C40 family peptidase [Corynebacterium epidermidicanis]|uniref:C40 family peptidase n=1 Tax=Corynebacterium epidermidicanis TaxID=1050174 RepID=UPI001F15CD11|nr:C40 family peptidase [Corynebacterium epidermidicanis]
MNSRNLTTRALGLALACAVLSSPCAVADPVSAPAVSATPAPNLDSITSVPELMTALEQASKKASAKNEEFKQTQQDIQAKEKEVASAKESVAKAKSEIDSARAAESLARADVEKLAQSRYRGVNVDPLTAVINADGPQNAIDRSAYMTAYARKAKEALARQEEATRDAGEAHSKAARLEAKLNYQMADLQYKRSVQEKQESELKDRIEKIQKRVDGLNKEERAAWEAKNNPVAGYSLAGVNGSNPEGMKALEAAMTKLGSPYGWGATGPNVFDCSGLVVWSYAQQGKTLPRTSQAQMAGGIPVSRADLQPGDVVGYYPGATHVGIYAGNGKLVHASDYGIPVQVVDVDSMPFYGARRY